MTLAAWFEMFSYIRYCRISRKKLKLKIPVRH